MANPNFTISSLRGGQNDWDPPIALPGDQVVAARNVEFYSSLLGERRRGADNISLSGAASGVTTADRVTFIHRHLPTSNETEAQLWLLAVTGVATSSVVAYKDTTWHSVTPNDAITLTSPYQFQLQAQSLHGKMFLAHKSAQDRLHVWDGNTLRRSGIIAQSAAPTGANEGAGTYSGTRYIRTRMIELSGGVVVRRSEPSPVLTFSPSGAGAGVTVTRGALVSEGETHWEVEFSLDNANFYNIARVATGTTTYVNETPFADGYSPQGPLSPTSGDYSLIPSGRYLAADQDRLLIAGSFENAALTSRVSWTPVFGDPGVGNDERIPIATNNFLDLDNYEGGPITGISNTVNGAVWVFKRNHIYKLVRTGIRASAYQAVCISKQRGAIEGSIVEAVDQAGRPCVYFLDPHVGPCRIGANGVERCGADIFTTWQTVILAAKVQARSIYYPAAQQVHWWVPTGSADVPTLQLVLQVNEQRDSEEGARRGWSIWDGSSATILATCLFSDNIDTGAARNFDLVPFIAVEGDGLVWRTDTGTDDNGHAYSAYITTKPYDVGASINQFGVMAAAVTAKAVSGASIDVSVIRDYGLETKTVSGVSFTPTLTEGQVIKQLDDLNFAECYTSQIKFSDVTSPGGRWELNKYVIKLNKGQSA